MAHPAPRGERLGGVPGVSVVGLVILTPTDSVGRVSPNRHGGVDVRRRALEDQVEGLERSVAAALRDIRGPDTLTLDGSSPERLEPWPDGVILIDSWPGMEGPGGGDIAAEAESLYLLIGQMPPISAKRRFWTLSPITFVGRVGTSASRNPMKAGSGSRGTPDLPQSGFNWHTSTDTMSTVAWNAPIKISGRPMAQRVNRL